MYGVNLGMQSCSCVAQAEPCMQACGVFEATAWLANARLLVPT